MQDFHVQKIIFSGKTVVKKYLHRPSKKEVVIKSFNMRYNNNPLQKPINELNTRLIKEISSLTSLSLRRHKNIVKFYGSLISVDQLSIFICMEHMDMSLDGLYLKVHQFEGCFNEKLLGAVMIAILHALHHIIFEKLTLNGQVQISS